MRKLQLYTITDTTTKKRLDETFTDKRSAKIRRKELNDDAGQTLRYVVSPGPDHRNYKE